MKLRLALLAALTLVAGCYYQVAIEPGGGGGPGTPSPSPTATPFYGPSEDTVFPISQ
jgi:hypothetical protein